MPNGENDDSINLRSRFFDECAKCVSKKVLENGLDLELTKDNEKWRHGCAWTSPCLDDFYGKLPVGNIVLTAVSGSSHAKSWTPEEKATYMTQDGKLTKLTFELGVRNEFDLKMTPSYALRLLAFFHMAENSSLVKDEKWHVYFDWHNGNNWQLNLCHPICSLPKDLSIAQDVQSQQTWNEAIAAVVQSIPKQVELIRQLRATPIDDLECTENVLRDLLGWYNSNKAGKGETKKFSELPDDVRELVGSKISQLEPDTLPESLAFLRDRPDKPISEVRPPRPANRRQFFKWLDARVESKMLEPPTRQAYIGALSGLDQKAQKLFDDYGIRSVYEIKTSTEAKEFTNKIKDTQWYQNMRPHRQGVAHGGTPLSAALKLYETFLEESEQAQGQNEKPPTTNEHAQQELLTMTLRELFGKPDCNKLLTSSKPVYLESPWGRMENNAWRTLYNAVWATAWAKKKDDIINHGAMVIRKNSEAYYEKPQHYYSLDDQYATYNKYGTCNLIHRIAKLYVTCGVALEDVQVCFLPNAEPVAETTTDADLNTILYGPPGTGKTYHTVAYAVAICTGRPVAEVMAAAKDDYQSVKSEYNGLVLEGRIAFATFHQSYEYGDFIEGIRPEEKGGVVTYSVEPGVFRKFCDEAGDEPCVFIIDEINRGNISKILGELITLIEPSKRESQHVTLPLSGDDFTVPRNVYILGTMNTADRSIAMMDTALRRRFDFVPMAPQPELLPDNVEGVNVARMLEVMNKRIEWLYDADHAIGHALFWTLHGKPTLAELARIFRKKIIPQLQEYFHDDYRKVQLVMGKSKLIQECPLQTNLFMQNVDDELPNAQYHVLPEGHAAWLDSGMYRAIYEQSQVTIGDS